MNELFTYLRNLQQNNQREWFHAHKPERMAATQQFEKLVNELNIALADMDETIAVHDPKTLTYRFNRDLRFAKDKTPYMPAFRANIAPHGKAFIPVGYYLFIMPGNRSFLGGGLYADSIPEVTEAIRKQISRRPQEFMTILEEPDFKQDFEVLGTKLKRMPRGFEEFKDSTIAEYLKHKSWHLSYELSDSDLLESPNVIEEAIDVFQRIKPFNHFINRAL
ncbi:TIGR02453 family protein [Enterococcus florum]|uniref:TIGR02453 family protein n=1 Tax=Enterococcus florum TaxID=2480627 RepID=A0A4P5P7V5_9ENTE|nr:DUF2461 domain-containing protein [Enterococcus florum]GCF93586.1 TIGR02453 family protein [Enterococcus florum]